LAPVFASIVCPSMSEYRLSQAACGGMTKAVSGNRPTVCRSATGCALQDNSPRRGRKGRAAQKMCNGSCATWGNRIFPATAYENLPQACSVAHQMSLLPAMVTTPRMSQAIVPTDGQEIPSARTGAIIAR
jgi:hypothetical protein